MTLFTCLLFSTGSVFPQYYYFLFFFKSRYQNRSPTSRDVARRPNLSPHWWCNYLSSRDQTSRGVEWDGCAPICALKAKKKGGEKEKDKHLQSRKRRHFADGSQAVNLNQGVFFPLRLPQGLFTSFAFADNSSSGRSKYRHKALPFLLSEAPWRSGSIRSPLPTEVAVAPFTFPFPSTAVVVTEALSGASVELLACLHRKSATHSNDDLRVETLDCRRLFFVFYRNNVKSKGNTAGEYLEIYVPASQPPPPHTPARLKTLLLNLRDSLQSHLSSPVGLVVCNWGN